MRLTVLGGCGGWPAAGLACSGYLVEHDGFRLLIDPGYATVPRLLTVADAADVDAAPGDRLEVGPFGVRSWLLPYWLPNAGLRLEADGQALAYTGDSGPSPLLAGAGRLVLTHLWPGTDPDEAVRAAAASYPGEIAVASPGLVTDAAPR